MTIEENEIFKTVRDDLKMGKSIMKTIWNRVTEEDKKDIESFKRASCKIINPRSFKFDKLNELKDVEKGANLLLENIKENKRIVLITDYDCDGISCAAVGTRFFRDIYKYPIEVYVNRRMFGNGINDALLDTISNLDKVDLIITADHGSADDERYMRLKSLNKNMKILVTDHHTFEEKPKHVDIFINNQREDNEVYLEFSGCAIFCCLLRKTLEFLSVSEGKEKEAHDLFLSFMAMTLVSDVMCMRDEDNRNIVKKGVPKLYKLLNLDYIGTDLAFKVTPMINSGNRMHKEELSYNYLIAETDEEREIYFKELNQLNEERKEITKEILEKVTVNEEPIKVIQIYTRYGVNGLIAGKIADQYNAPTFCLQNDGSGILHGSSRGNGADVLKLLQKANEAGILLKYGGHKNAAGFTIKEEKYDDFFKLMVSQNVEKEYTEYTTDVYLKQVLIPKIVLSKSVITPFGKNFEEPIFEATVTFNKIYNNSGDIYALMFNSGYSTFFAKYKNIHNKNIEELLISGKRYKIKFNIIGSTGPVSVNVLEIKEN